MDKVVTVRCLDDSVKITRMLNKGFQVTGEIPFNEGYIVTLRKDEGFPEKNVEDIRIVNIKDNNDYAKEINNWIKQGYKIDRYTTATVIMIKEAKQ